MEIYGRAGQWTLGEPSERTAGKRAALAALDPFELEIPCKCGSGRGVVTVQGTFCRRCGKPTPEDIRLRRMGDE